MSVELNKFLPGASGITTFSNPTTAVAGDFRGLTEQLDYLHELGISAIWLLPFYPSPLKDDGYDIADYFSINPIYGTLKDFRVFLHRAHERNLRVITELVVTRRFGTVGKFLAPLGQCRVLKGLSEGGRNRIIPPGCCSATRYPARCSSPGKRTHGTWV